MLIKEIQEQINKLQEQVNLLTIETTKFNWEDAPTIVEINGSRWILGPECYDELDWDAAVAWCKSVGGELPPRDISLQCYMNADIKKEVSATHHWSSTELSASNAWYQNFYSGYQSDNYKSNAYSVRAVRRLDI